MTDVLSEILNRLTALEDAANRAKVQEKYNFSMLKLKEIAAPGTPASGFGNVYAGIDGLLYYKNDAGVITAMVEYNPRTDYSATSTIVGWGVFTSKVIQISQAGKLNYVQFDIRGTSNSVATSFTVLNANGTANIAYFLCLARDNTGTYVPGLGGLAASGTTINFYKDLAGGAWTAGGTKEIRGVLVYID